MDLNTLWFILIAVLYIGFFVTDGFDLGVGILLPFLGKDEAKRRILINAIGPHWDGNEVWLLTAGGATFAAFPNWYATLFSGFYFPLFLILIGLILRGVAFEFRSKDDNPRWRQLWDWALFVGSLLPALLLGVAFANFMRGVPIDGKMMYVGGFWNLLNPYALLGGVVSLLGLTLHGAVFLSLKLEDDLLKKAQDAAWKLWIPTVVALVLFTVATYFSTDFLSHLGLNPGVVPVGTIMAGLGAGYFIYVRRSGWAFFLTSLTILLSVSTIFMMLFPRVLISSVDPNFSLTIYNAASGPVTLKTMTIVTLILVPIVLAYQAWMYWIFRKRVGKKSELHY